MQRAIRVLIWTFVSVAASRAMADEAEIEFFEKKIRPVLVTYCYECHSADAKTPGGDLLLDSREGLRQGGDTGPAVRAGNPDDSLLIKAVRYTDDAVKMPPKGKLPEAVIADLEAWVRAGAKDSRDQPSRKKSTAPWSDVMKQRSDWWSLHPVSHPTVPPARETTHNWQPVDRFIEAKLAEHGLKLADTTDPRTFARRLSLVLTGLPPAIEQVDRFVAQCQNGDPSDRLPASAVESLVDSLLLSPHFGEHWARHWMDVVRFSETHGNEWNYEVHHAWRYRDYLIRAFNDDVPYDQFVREHIAGDLLPHPRWNEREQINESVIGTGFYRFGEVNHDDCISLRSIGYDLADNQIDTLTKAFQATTVACARCHHHKLDAVSSEDYYALLAVLRSSRNVSHCIDSPEVNAAPRKRMQELKSELRRELAAQWIKDAGQFARYLEAAHAVRTKRSDAADLSVGLDQKRLETWLAVLAAEKQPFDEPFEVLRRLSNVELPGSLETPADATQVAKSMPQVWLELRDHFEKESKERTQFNTTMFEPFADFQRQDLTGWMQGGQAMRDLPSRAGDFVVELEGDALVRSILPAGRFTHALSSKLNGTLRSPVLPLGKKYISFQVLGQRSSALRLVSNHCQLNYANYRALTNPDLTWITFSPPDDRESLRTYAELMTMFDNPKFPDQLSALGGDGANYKLPWDKAAENPRSYFGVTRVVLHGNPETPRPELSHLNTLFLESRRIRDCATDDSKIGAKLRGEADPLFDQIENSDAAAGKNPRPASSESKGIESTAAEIAAASQQGEEVAADQVMFPTFSGLGRRYVMSMASAVHRFGDNRATEDDVRWLDAMLKRELLSNKMNPSARAAELVNEYRKVEASLSIPRIAVGVSDGGPGIEQPVFLRGDCARPGDKVPRRYLEVLSKSTEPFTSEGSGRLELAERIANPNNPLTARVMVNRIWHHLFGTGLVRTVDDFGHVGELPSHPELLDFLANQFVETGWSVKQMIRSLVLTRTFQASHVPSKLSRELDPQNRLLQHYSARRMEAESVRDSILMASGGLVSELYGHSIQPFREKEYADRRLFPGPLDGNGRRSVYIKNNLMEGPKFLAAFNFPGGKVAQGRRDVTNVPAQALALLNDPFVLQQAGVWSQRLLSRSGDSVATRIDAMFRSSLGRSPTAEEQSRFDETIRELAGLYQVPAENVMSSVEIWKDVSHAIFNFNEMIYIP